MDSLIGLTIGNFQIIELTGRGGMSSVYLAADKELERSVALKIPHTRFIDNPGFVKRFRREAKAMARLRHPNIVQIYSVGNHGEMPFFAMEYIHGEALSRVIRRDGPLKVDVALDYIGQIARAVEYAHRMDVIHRDIKPANILVDSSGSVLVTDFGVSKLLSDESSQDTLGFVGTPQYMSPEQCGQGILDHRTDIYSLGAVFFEMLTGRPPFSCGSPAETIKKQLFDTPEFPEESRNRIPERIQSIVSKMLAKDPEQRYPDIPVFLQEIEELDRDCAEPTFDELKGKESVQGTIKQRTKDFISNPNGQHTRWPVFVFAGLAAVGIVLLSTSFTLSNGGGPPIRAIKNIIPNGANHVHLAPAHASSTPIEGSGSTGSPGKNLLAAYSPASTQKPVTHVLGVDAGSTGKTPVTGTVGPDGEAGDATNATGFVIDSEPRGADVFIDSELCGKTPLTLPDIAPGNRMLVMTLKGFPAYSEEVPVDPSDPSKVFHDFVAAKEALIPKGNLTVDSIPSGADVYIDGKKEGKTPLELPALRAAEYGVELRCDGYENLAKNVMLEPDADLRLSLELVEKPKFGDLNVDSQPDGAEVLLNGTLKGNTPLVLRRMPVGDYKVVLRRDGYKPVNRQLVCEKDVIRTLDVRLEMTPQFAALQSIIAGDAHMHKGDFDGAITAYERAVSLDPDKPAYHQKLGQARRSLLVEQVKAVLLAYKSAYESEDTQLLASLLDDEDAHFVAGQITNAEKLFHEFDNINVALSRVQIDTGAHDAQVFVGFHLTIGASFAETGLAVALLDSDQRLILRKEAEDNWKLCAIE